MNWANDNALKGMDECGLGDRRSTKGMVNANGQSGLCEMGLHEL